jgi:hypothetical protein
MPLDKSVAMPQKWRECNVNEYVAKNMKNRNEAKGRVMNGYYCSRSFAPRYFLQASNPVFGSLSRVFSAALLRSSSLTRTG